MAKMMAQSAVIKIVLQDGTSRSFVTGHTSFNVIQRKEDIEDDSGMVMDAIYKSAELKISGVLVRTEEIQADTEDLAKVLSLQILQDKDYTALVPLVDLILERLNR